MTKKTRILADNTLAPRLDELISFSELSESNLPSREVPLQEVPPKDPFLSHFDLLENPFLDNLNTNYYFKSAQCEEALLKMRMSIEHQLSFTLVTGLSGTGKTYLSQLLLESMPTKKFKPVLVPVNPGFSPTAFLDTLIRAMDLTPRKQGKSIHNMVQQISEEILQTMTHGIHPVLLIDEAHFLSSQSLHLLRTLSNFECFNQKLLSSILFAEPAFKRRLSNPSYASLRNRIYLEIELKPLNKNEFISYINQRLENSNKKSQDLFSKSALKEIYEQSNGIPRQINKACLNHLLKAYFSGAC